MKKTRMPTKLVRSRLVCVWLMMYVDARQTQAEVIYHKIFSNQPIIRHFHHDNSLSAEIGVLILVR